MYFIHLEASKAADQALASVPEEHESYEEPHYVDDLHALLEMGEYALRPDGEPSLVAEYDDEIADVIEMSEFFANMNRQMGGSE